MKSTPTIETRERVLYSRRRGGATEAQLEALFEAAHVGIAFLNRDLRIIRINRALSDIHGNPPMAEVGLHVREVVPAVAPIVEPRLRRVMDAAEVIHGQELERVTPRVSFARVDFLPIHAAGRRAEGVAVIFEDRSSIERARKASARAEHLSALLAELTQLGHDQGGRVPNIIGEALEIVCAVNEFCWGALVRFTRDGVETLSEWRDGRDGYRSRSLRIGTEGVTRWLVDNRSRILKGTPIERVGIDVDGRVPLPAACAAGTVAIPVVGPGIQAALVFHSSEALSSHGPQAAAWPDIAVLRAIALVVGAANPAVSTDNGRRPGAVAASPVRAAPTLVGASGGVKAVIEAVQSVATTRASVLITGESGVGKELVASLVHFSSDRAHKPFVKVNCASIPGQLFESEFFGHVRGAFTSAHRDRPGRFELADCGTLFLDEVSEIPLELQAKLLRVLQEGSFERVGDRSTRTVDVRIIAATNRDLAREIEEGRFRRDLYYRLGVFPIQVPPLRDRAEDIVPLARYFHDKHCRAMGREALTLEEEHEALLLKHSWPGNVRKLENVIERAVILSREPPLRLDLALSKIEAAMQGGEPVPALMTAAELRDRERENLIAALEASGWRVSGKGGAADRLEMHPSTLRDRLKSLGIRRP